ncbi:ATP synthase F0 subunit B [Candidatus Roizmanbacteria bacterium]|nr:ATP synthase F0 subunit B [Candidatus Roizmanbacteria bacterium]
MENLGIDGKLLLAQLVNFVLFFYIFKRFIAKPFAAFLKGEAVKEKEKQKIMDEIKESELAFEVQKNEMKLQMRKQLDEAIKKAKDSAEKVRADLIEDAKKEASVLVEKGKKQIVEERVAMQREMKNKVSELGLFLVSESLKDYLDKDAQQALTKYILKNLERSVSSS